LNEIYPDKRLAQAAFRAARPGVFPLGARGAGRLAKFGGFFGCNAFSGQGGAVRTHGEIKVAAFVVVNSYGMVTKRDGQAAACFGKAEWPDDLRTVDLLRQFPAYRQDGWPRIEGEASGHKTNTTLTLVVVNQKLTVVELQRLAVQVHASMGRVIQPFATFYDGDVLYAVSTAEVEQQHMSATDLGVLASETVWDAVLAAVPEQPTVPDSIKEGNLTVRSLRKYVGDYRFSDTASLGISMVGEELFARATGSTKVFAIDKHSPTKLQVISDRDFSVPGRYPLLLRFESEGKLILNPGHWEQVGKKVD
jgi:L-aminopeptidase/D-esterase-like protein